MTAPRRARVRLLLACPDTDEYSRTYAPRFVAEGAPIHTARLRPIGTEVDLVVELLDGSVMFDGPAAVVAHLELGGPGYVLSMLPAERAPDVSSEWREYVFEELRPPADPSEPLLGFWSVPLERRRKRSG